ncbi:MAG: AAA family ATPase [Patescibacteria group bacterium]
MKTLGFQSMTLVPGSYLFAGPEMIGKKTYALELAHDIADASDIVLVDSPLIDAIRDVKQFLSLTPFAGTAKIAIIDHAEKLTEDAQNALLKMLEEPNRSSICILVTSSPDSLLPTILSRCQQFFFPAHGRKVYDEFFATTKLSKAQQDFLYEFSNGSIGLLYNLDYQKIKAYAEEFTKLSQADISQRFTAAQQLAEDESLPQKILFWMLYLRTKKLYKPLRGLLELYNTISKPQFGKQLALEQFMLEL